MRCLARWMTASILLAMTTIVALPVAANPSSKDPSRPLAAHGTIEGAKELVDQLYQLYAEEAKFVEQTYARMDDPTSFSDRQISKSAGRLWKARRDAKRLQIMGEPAGYDLFKKLQLLATEVYKFGQAYRGTPRGNQLAQRIQVKLGREIPQMKRFLQQADAAIQQGKLEIFETQMEKKGQELTEQLVFFNAAGSQPFDEAFYAVLSRGDALLEKKRKADYAEQVASLINKQLSVITAFDQDSKRIVRALAETGTVQLTDGLPVGSAQAFAHVGSQWGVASAALLRANALQWAFPAAPSSSMPDAKQLKEMAITTLAQIIESAVRTTSAEDVQGVYCDMLVEISVLDRRNGIMNLDVSRGCHDALEKLVAKDPALHTRRAAYERATSEVLRWRQAYAAEQATRLGGSVLRANALLSLKGQTKIKIRPPYARSVVGDTLATPLVFSDPADWMVQEAADRLVDEPIIEDRVIRLTPTSRVSVIPLGNSHYANLPAPFSMESEVSDLLTALMVDDTHRPLTLQAANAVSAANLQDFETVMAQIDTVHLESVVTRMIDLPDAAYPLVNLGNTAVLNEQVAPIEQTCWRLDLRPLWARHLCFTVRVAAATGQEATEP